jgi:hypothetical protein
LRRGQQRLLSLVLVWDHIVVPRYDGPWQPGWEDERQERIAARLIDEGIFTLRHVELSKWPDDPTPVRSRYTREELLRKMDYLPRGREGRRGVLGGPVARTAAVVGTAAVVKHGHDRRADRRDDRGDRREDRRDDRGPGIFR